MTVGYKKSDQHLDGRPSWSLPSPCPMAPGTRPKEVDLTQAKQGEAAGLLRGAGAGRFPGHRESEIGLPTSRLGFQQMAKDIAVFPGVGIVKAAVASTEVESFVRSGQSHQSLKVSAVGRSEGFEVSVARLPPHLKVHTTPCERRPSKILYQPVGAEPRVAPIAVREGVDTHELVMELDSQAIWILGLKADPVCEVTAQLADCLDDLWPRATNVLVGDPVFSRPDPDPTEHFSMNALQGGVGEEVLADDTAAACPKKRLYDVRFFCAVQRLPCTNVQS